MIFDNYANTLKSGLKELYDARNILRSLIVRSLFGRYKNSILGFAWNFIIPLIMMLVYYIVFTQIRTTAIPDFWVYIASALFPFNFMMSNILNGPSCIVTNGSMVKKMYFPRSIIVLAQVLSSFIVMIIGYVVVLLLLLITGYECNGSLLTIPLIMIMMCFFIIGLTLSLSSITVYVRDIQYLISSLSMVFFFMTPMYFVANSVGGTLSNVIWINPLTYYVEMFHEAVYYSEIPTLHNLIVGLILSIVSMIIGCIVFNRLKRGFAEKL